MINLFALLLLGSLLVGADVSAQELVKTFAGSTQVSGATDGAALQARFSDPAGIAVDGAGNVFIADNQNHTIRKIALDGTVTTLAGQPGNPGSADGTGAAAQFDSPAGLAVDRNGVLYVTDSGNHTIRRINASGVVTTLAGFAGESGATNGPAAQARFTSPLGVAATANGTLYIADSGNHLIRKLAPDGTVSTFAGDEDNFGSNDGVGTAARFNTPVGLALDALGNLFVADANNHTIRKITPDGTVTTFAGLAGADGSADGMGAAARFSKPAELALDRNSNLFVADAFTHTIRKVTPAGEVSTISGATGEDGASDGANRTARFFNPYGLAVSPKGNLFVTDTYNQTIRLVLVPFKAVLQISPDGALTTLTWDTALGSKYQVQVRSALAGAAWQNVGGAITATGLSAATTNAGGGTQRFYRVFVVE